VGAEVEKWDSNLERVEEREVTVCVAWVGEREF